MMRVSLLLIVLIAVAIAGCKSTETPTAPSVNVAFSATDLRVGTGVEATNGRTVTMGYAGWLYSTTAADNKGQQFDSGTYAFVLGSNTVIAGWNQGIVGMRVGGQRRLVIPPALGYGQAGSPPEIPGNATLVFDVELLSVQ
jgi:FKBP-type peptidyl-prolyl cis-trans isomerase